MPHRRRRPGTRGGRCSQVRNRYAGGIALYLEVVVQQNAALAAEQAELNARVRQYSAAVQLVKALGGGWEPVRLSLDAAEKPLP